MISLIYIKAKQFTTYFYNEIGILVDPKEETKHLKSGRASNKIKMRYNFRHILFKIVNCYLLCMYLYFLFNHYYYVLVIYLSLDKGCYLNKPIYLL